MSTIAREPVSPLTSSYLPRPARVLAVAKLTELERLLTLRYADGASLGHDPGQFVQVSLLGLGECPISICSSPTRGAEFELCVRRAGVVTSGLHRLDTGDVVGVRGPLGRGFDVTALAGRDVLIVAGGLGLAPVRSLIEYILDERGAFGEFHLLYGARAPGELLFRDELMRWAARRDLTLRVTVDRGDEHWRGRVGVVTTLFSQLPKLDAARTSAVVVGPPVMFKFVLLELLGRRIAQKDIYCSLERRMKCGVGRCGHCQVNQVYVCADGPVFNYAQLKGLRESLA
ncbi:MAG: FAD/NAD(P)-binding protein [Phycisphaerae bacterium]